ncbi:iron ABC transporter permease [Streptomyces sp. CH6]|uniref:iron ABC transporter permease n=1 Tax=Streptomyces sp. CH6 TaxID=3420320 RepID=UPI003D076B7C
MTATATRPPVQESTVPAHRGGAAALALGLLLVVVAFAVIDIAQGTSDVGLLDVWHAATGDGDHTSASVVAASRLPRAVAGLVVGLALGAAGRALQTMSRNVLASPDTLAVNAGSYLALALFAVTGVSVPLLASSGVAFVGALAASAVVLGVSGLGTGTVRLVLAGTALALGLSAVTQSLLLLFPQETEGLFQWNQGSIAQNGFDGILQMLPVIAVALLGLLLVSRRLDALALGDDAARGLGVSVGRTRLTVVVLTALLAAAAVTLTGPLGYAGLCAPALVRPLVARYKGFARTRANIPLAGLVGAGLVLGSDVLLRTFVTADRSTGIPTGTVTSLLGAVFLVVMAVRLKEGGDAREPERTRIPGRAAYLVTLAVIGAVLVGLVLAGALFGDHVLLLGDLAHWATGRAGSAVSFVLDTRVPRVLSALLAGAALALSGTLVQAVTRNPLAEPSVLGVSGGGALGAVLATTAATGIGTWGIAGAAFAGSAAAAALVFGLAARGGFRQNRVILVGIGVSAATTALIGLVIVLTDPFNATKALTWLSGSTYGRELPDLLPVGLALLLGGGVAVAHRRDLDLVSVDDDTPRLLGLPLPPRRLLLLGTAVVLTATAVAAAGTIGFVGLVAPHAARALVGRRHARVLPTAVLLGACLVTLADTLGRTVIAPAQLGAGLMTSLVGTPYFIYLLVRTRR